MATEWADGELESPPTADVEADTPADEALRLDVELESRVVGKFAEQLAVARPIARASAPRQRLFIPVTSARYTANLSNLSNDYSRLRHRTGGSYGHRLSTDRPGAGCTNM